MQLPTVPIIALLVVIHAVLLQSLGRRSFFFRYILQRYYRTNINSIKAIIHATIFYIPAG